MGLFELFKQTKITVTPGSQVSVKHITSYSLPDLLCLAKGDTLVIKQTILYKEALAFIKFPDHCTIVTTAPTSLEPLDAVNCLLSAKNISLSYLPFIGLNYLHFDDQLFVFGDFPDDVDDASPNVVRIAPVRRDDVKTIISIDDSLLSALPASEPQPGLIEDQHPDDGPSASFSTPEIDQEHELIAAKLKEVFNDQYEIIDVSITGASIEKKTISLSDFYAKHKIAKGQLKGSWNLIDPVRARKVMDVGIARRAIDEVLAKYTINIPNFGKISKKSDNACLRSLLSQIEKDYIAYLRGTPEVEKIGSIIVQTPFSPQALIKENLNSLENYLSELKHDDGWPQAKYLLHVKKFIAGASSKNDRLFSSVRLNLKWTVPADSQWTDKEFLLKLYFAMIESPDFANLQFLELLRRYTDTPHAQLSLFDTH